MTPSNPSNSQPLIYRIMDALGVTHLVACINHTHEQSEVDGLVASLNSKQNALTFDDAPTSGSNNPVKSGGIFTAIANAVANKLAKLTSFTTGNFVRVKSDGTLEDSGKKASDFADAAATATALAGKMRHAITGVTFDRDTDNNLNAGSGWSGFVSNVTEGELRFVSITIQDSYGGHTIQAQNVVAIAKWDYSASQVYKNVSIYICGVRYNLRYTVDDGSWGTLTKPTSSDLTPYLPE